MADPFTTALFTAIAHGTDPMVLSDPNLPDEPLIAINPAFEALTGYSSAEVIGRNCRFLQGPGTDPQSVRRIRSSLAAGQGCVEWIVNHRKDGAAFWNLLFLSPLHDAAGKVRYFFGNQHDITKGPPAWLTEFQLGPAHMPAANRDELAALLANIANNASAVPGAPVEQALALQRVVAAAHDVSLLTRQLAPGEE